MTENRLTERLKIVVVMPAYNAAQTLHQTWSDLPHHVIDSVILVDDHSSDETVRVARELGLQLFVHDRNYGYGANQKTCYVMVHPDYQYDPSLLPEIVRPIEEDRADVVLGSRLMGVNPVKQGMPWWKYVANRFLTKVENVAFGLHLSEYHTGYRAYKAEALRAVNFAMNSDGFIFDQQVMAQFVALQMRVAEVPVPTRYFPLASSASFIQSTIYGTRILYVVWRYWLHKHGLLRDRRLESLSRRYRSVSGSSAS